MGHFQRVCNGKRALPVKRERRAGIRLVETEDNNLLQEDHANDDEYLFVLRNSAEQHTDSTASPSDTFPYPKRC